MNTSLTWNAFLWDTKRGWQPSTPAWRRKQTSSLVTWNNWWHFTRKFFWNMLKKLRTILNTLLQYLLTTAKKFWNYTAGKPWRFIQFKEMNINTFQILPKYGNCTTCSEEPRWKSLVDSVVSARSWSPASIVILSSETCPETDQVSADTQATLWLFSRLENSYKFIKITLKASKPINEVKCIKLLK